MVEAGAKSCRCDQITAVCGRRSGVDIYNNFIDGAWIPARARGTFENRNPANRDDVIGLFQDSSRDDVEVAVQAAERADCSWRVVPAP